MNFDLPYALVGELNPYGSNPRFALYDEPPHASGARLRRILGLTVEAYRVLPKYNLCVGVFDPIAAHARALELREKHRFIVALGVKVRDAFPRAPRTWEAREDDHGIVLALPHPSGRSLAWNDPASVRRARELLVRHIPDVAWGIPDPDPDGQLRVDVVRNVVYTVPKGSHRPLYRLHLETCQKPWKPPATPRKTGG